MRSGQSAGLMVTGQPISRARSSRATARNSRCSPRRCVHPCPARSIPWMKATELLIAAADRNGSIEAATEAVERAGFVPFLWMPGTATRSKALSGQQITPGPSRKSSQPRSRLSRSAGSVPRLPRSRLCRPDPPGNVASAKSFKIACRRRASFTFGDRNGRTQRCAKT
jgi:hypothetical protein